MFLSSRSWLKPQVEDGQGARFLGTSRGGNQQPGGDQGRHENQAGKGKQSTSHRKTPLDEKDNIGRWGRGLGDSQMAGGPHDVWGVDRCGTGKPPLVE